MNIAIDITSWSNNRGYGRHVRSLLKSLLTLDRENRYTLISDTKVNLDNLPHHVDVRELKASSPTVVAASASGRRSIVDMWRVSRQLSSSEYDIIFFPTIYSYVPVFSRAKKLIAIHDIIPEKYPHFTHPKLSSRIFWDMKSTIGRWQADAIITVSEYSRQRLMEQFAIDPGEIFVVGEASDPIFRVVENPVLPEMLTAAGINKSDRMIVYVGGFGPHKNLVNLVEVFARLVNNPGFDNVYLVMVGEYKEEVFYSDHNNIVSTIKNSRIEERVVFPGFIPDKQLVDILNLAALAVLPSLMEGFGLPAIEAAACACPVIATTESPLPGLLGEGGIYIDPTKPAELEQALSSILSSAEQREKMAVAANESAKKLSWEMAAAQLLDIFRTI